MSKKDDVFEQIIERAKKDGSYYATYSTKKHMSNKDEALKLALEALESCNAGDYSTGHVIHPSFDEDAVNKAIEAIEALAEQPAHPVVPDAIHHTDLSESLEYIQGWNDCRAAMLEGKENT